MTDGPNPRRAAEARLDDLAPAERLIVALDVRNAGEARRVAAAVGDAATSYKVGKELFTAAGPDLVRELVNSGRSVFLDLKFHDIPNTVAGAVRSAAGLGVSMLTVHAAGGGRMLEAAVEAARGAVQPPMLLAVTVLTNLRDADLRETGVEGNAQEQVLRLARLARAAGCGGVVASPAEVAALRRELGEKMAVVTPGVRPAGAAVQDQARVATPEEAIAAGASHVVVGRPILEAADPKLAVREILKEIAAGLARRQR